MPTFDTVSDLKSWLEDEEPSVSEAVEALEDEQAGDDRVTAVAALEEYVDSNQESDEEEPDDSDITGDTRFRVTGEIDGYARGEVVHLDPGHPQVVRWRDDGRLIIQLG